MSGIVVGIDGSGHSQRALEWAFKEAALRHVPVTVFTVHQAVRDNLGFIASSPGDADLTAKAEAAAKAETEKVLAVLGQIPAGVGHSQRGQRYPGGGTHQGGRRR